MKSRFILLISSTFCTLGAAFQHSHNGILRDLPTTRPPPVTAAMSSSDSPDDDGSLSEFDVSKEETLLRVNFSFDDDAGGSALAAVQRYTKTFPFAACLPVQPLTYLPGESRALAA